VSQASHADLISPTLPVLGIASCEDDSRISWYLSLVFVFPDYYNPFLMTPSTEGVHKIKPNHGLSTQVLLVRVATMANF